MKIGFFVLLSLVLAQFASAQLVTNSQPVSPLLAKLDTLYGFGDLKFEQSIDSCKDMTLLEDDEDIKFYSHKGDSLELGGAKLKSIDYGFYKGKLATIVITSEPDDNGAALLKAFEKEYGPATKAPHNPKKFYWFGERVTGDYLATDSGQASIDLWSKPLQLMRAADSKSKH